MYSIVAVRSGVDTPIKKGTNMGKKIPHVRISQ